MELDEAIERALLTWYPPDHPLHFNPHHPLGKLLGEWGELLDDYMKSLYKPGYVFEPEDELGDIWYYTRILCYQQGYSPRLYTNLPEYRRTIDHLIALVMIDLAKSFTKNDSARLDNYVLDHTFCTMVEICTRNNLTLNDLTKSNWEKLKPGSERGEQWTKARMSTDYIGGKIGLK